MRAFKALYNFNALISLLPTKNGGRKRHVYDHYRPAFSFRTANQFSGEITFIGVDKLKPGATAQVNVKLLPSRNIPLNLKSGDAFTIMEGERIVGTGVIEDILEDRRLPIEPIN